MGPSEVTPAEKSPDQPAKVPASCALCLSLTEPITS